MYAVEMEKYLIVTTRHMLMTSQVSSYLAKPDGLKAIEGDIQTFIDRGWVIVSMTPCGTQTVWILTRHAPEPKGVPELAGILTGLTAENEALRRRVQRLQKNTLNQEDSYLELEEAMARAMHTIAVENERLKGRIHVLEKEMADLLGGN